MKHVLPEEQLIEYAKSYLKAKGFKKKNKRWTKDTGEFTLCFYIQGSSYSKEDYYIRPGISKRYTDKKSSFWGVYHKAGKRIIYI